MKFKELNGRSDFQLNLSVAKQLDLSCQNRSDKFDGSVQLKNGEFFNPVANDKDWGKVITAMLDMGYEFSLDSEGIFVTHQDKTMCFDDELIGRRIVKAFLLSVEDYENAA